MRNRASNKILAFALAAVMVLGMFTASPSMTAYAAGPIEMQEGMPQITYATNGVNANTVTVVGFAGHEWYVIGYNGSGVASETETMTLLAKNHDFNTTAFGSYSKYDDSTLHTKMQELYNTTLFTNTNVKEKDLVLKCDLDGVWDGNGSAEYNYNGTLADQYIWPLSYEEAAALNDSYSTDTVMAFGSDWWLRSPGISGSNAAVVDASYGTVFAYGDPVGFDFDAIRPAFKLNLESVIFTSAAVGGKSSATVGSGLVGASAPTQNLKFTVLDSDTNNLDLTSATANKSAVKAGDTVEVTFAGAKTGSAAAPAWEKFVSCVLVNSSGEITHYGKLSDQSDSTANFTVPAAADLPDGTYTLRVFNEQCYDGNYTDFASSPIEITLEVDNTAPTVTATPSGTNISISTTYLVLTFSEEIDITTAGTVTMYPDVIAGNPDFTQSNIWDMDKKVLTIPLSNLGYNTTYNISISGFKDMVGNVINAVSGLTFTTEKENHGITVNTMTNGSVTVQGGFTQATEGTQINLTVTPENEYRLVTGSLKYNTTPISGTSFTMPDEPVTIYAEFEPIPEEPSVSQTSLTVDVNDTAQFTVYLGKGSDAADSATVTSHDDSIAIATPTSVTTSGQAITVTGRSVGVTQISIGWSGGPKDSTTTTVDVEVKDSTPPPIYHTVTFNLAGGTRTGGGDLIQTVLNGSAATAPITTRNGYTFDGWDKGFSNVTAPMTVTAQWRKDNNGNGGSSSSGNSGNNDSYTPPPIIIVTEKQPNQPTVASTEGKAIIKDKRAAFTITDAMVKALLEQAREDARKAGKTADGIGIRVNLAFGSTAGSMVITIEDKALERLNTASDLKFFAINNPLVNLSFDPKAAKQLKTQTGGNVTISVNPVDKLSDQAKAAIGSRPVFDILISYMKNGKTGTVTDFKDGKVTLGIAYTPGKDEKTGNIFGVYVPNSGKPEWLTNSSYDGGRVIFSRSTLSVYGVGYKTSAPAFADTKDHWAKDNIDFVASRGLISGTGDTAYSPNTTVTRAVFLTALGRLSGQDMSKYTASSFTDVSNANPAMPYIEWAVKNNIAQGVGGGRFNPDAAITREDMAVMMVNYAKATKYTLPVARQAVTFADDGQISAYAKDAVKALQQAGVVSGVGAGRFNPKGTATRAEAATILRNFVELVIDPGTARGWVKNDAGQQMYYTWDGGRVTGWLTTTADNKYWFDGDGIMQTGKWLQIGGKWYYFEADGKLATNTTIDGYEVGADGARKDK